MYCGKKEIREGGQECEVEEDAFPNRAVRESLVREGAFQQGLPGAEEARLIAGERRFQLRE